MFFIGRGLMTVHRLCPSNITAVRNYKVTVIGGASEIGQTVSLMLKTQPSVTNLSIHDTLDQTQGVALDLSHVPTETRVRGFTGDTLHSAIKDADLILITGGISKMPGITSSSLLNTNTDYIKAVCTRIARGPMPFVGIVTEPLNNIVPMAAEIMKAHGDYNPKKLFGITGIDVIRAQALFAAEYNLNPYECVVPVIGGHTDKTMIPLLSKTRPVVAMTTEKVNDLTNKLLKADENIIRAKRGWGPSVSVAYSALIFTQAVISAQSGQPTRVHAYIENNDFGTSFFSGFVNVNREGAGEMQRYENLTPYELKLLESSIVELRKEITKGRKILEMA